MFVLFQLVHILIELVVRYVVVVLGWIFVFMGFRASYHQLLVLGLGSFVLDLVDHVLA